MVTSWTTEMMEAVFGRTNYSVIIMMLILWWFSNTSNCLFWTAIGREATQEATAAPGIYVIACGVTSIANNENSEIK
jgi:hypothetical protein